VSKFKILSTPPLVWFIIILSCIPYILLNIYNLNAISLWFMPTSIDELLQPSGFWRLWTPTFVHYSLLHLSINLYLWWLYAVNIERESRTQLLLVLVISAAIGNLSQWSMTGSNFGGLSGVVFALLSYRWILVRFAGKLNYSIDIRLGRVLLALIPLGAMGWLGKLSNYAHLGGLASGAMLAVLYIVMNNRK